MHECYDLKFEGKLDYDEWTDNRVCPGTRDIKYLSNFILLLYLIIIST